MPTWNTARSMRYINSYFDQLRGALQVASYPKCRDIYSNLGRCIYLLVSLGRVENG